MVAKKPGNKGAERPKVPPHKQTSPPAATFVKKTRTGSNPPYSGLERWYQAPVGPRPTSTPYKR